MIFALYYCEIITRKNRYLILLILLPLILLYTPALTKNYFHLIIEQKVIGENGWTEWGIFFKITYILTFLYSITGIVLVIIKSLKDYRYIRLRKALIIVAVLIPLSVNVVTSFGVVKAFFDYTPVSFSICFVLFSVSIFKLRLFDITPVAVNNIFGSMEEAILIMNNENSIVDYNKAAVTEFSNFLDIRDVKNIDDFFGSLRKHTDDTEQIDQLLDMLGENNYDNIDFTFFTLKKGQEGHKIDAHYCFCMKPLVDESGNHIGSIVSFKNVSEFKKVTLDKERSRLSGDLHDTLGNCIMAICANLKYAIEKFNASEDILLCIKQAHSAATGGILYLRQIVEELTPLDIEKNGLIWALQSLFKKLEATGSKIDFHYSGADENTVNKSRYSNIIYKTCQEALNNSFYHGKAKEIFINLIFTSDEIKLYISDDGVGCSNIIKGKGLSGIEERARSVGGSVEFGSPSDGGFNIRITMPLQYDRMSVKNQRTARGGSV